MKQLKIIFIIFLFVIKAKAQDHNNEKNAYYFSLEQCIKYALYNNYNHQIMKLTEEAQYDLYNQAKRQQLPNLNAQLSESYINLNPRPVWNGIAGINTSIILYQGKMIVNTIERNNFLIQQAIYKTKQFDYNLVIQILQTFITALGNQELLKSQEDLLQVTKEQVDEGEKQYKLGSILESDYLLLEAQYATNKNNIVDTQIALENSLLALKILLSIDTIEKFNINNPETNTLENIAILPPQNDVLEKAIENLPDLKINDYTIEAAKMGIKLAQANLFPTISLNGGIGNGRTNFFTNFESQFSSSTLYQQIGLSITIPIYNNNRYTSQITQNKIQLEQAELTKKQTQLTLKQTIIQEYKNTLASYSKYQADNVSQNAYLKTFLAYNAKFKSGAITAVNLLQQQNNYITALNSYIQSKYEFILNRKMLDVYMGDPVKM